MSSKRLYQIINSAYINNDTNAMRDAYNEYLNTHCLRPQRVRIVDSHTQKVSFIDTPCGRCEHCMQTKVNEWCTRMYAHAEDFKHIYFVTLTYRSFMHPDHPRNKLLLSKLSQAVWHLDSYNQTKRYCYNPCILCKDHYQKFLKKLRKYSGLNDITYVVSGEYGKTYGRPHFHLILFTNGTLTPDIVRRAWTVSLWKSVDGSFAFRRNQRYGGKQEDYLIGNVDFHDLVSNGTFNTKCKIKVDNNIMSAANCFAYVCKYVVKRGNINFSRLNLAHRNLFYKETFVNCYNRIMPFSDVENFLTNNKFPLSDIDTIINSLKQHTYEKTIYRPTGKIINDFLIQKQKVTKENYSFILEVLPPAYFEFRSKFSPFVEFSRGTPIGSVYAKNHIQEFAQDVFKRPILQDSGFVVPSYFRLKAQQYNYGLRKIRQTLKSRSFAFSGLVDLYRRFESDLQNSSLPREYLHCLKDYQDISPALRSPLHAFADSFTGERIILYNEHAQHYKFDRHTRSYKFTRAVPVADWLRHWCTCLQDELKRFASRTQVSKENMRLVDAASCIMTDIGDDTKTIQDRYEKLRSDIKRYQDSLYHESHASVE